MNTAEIANRLALKNLVDTFSTLADTKEVEAQLDLFKDDATVESFTNGESVGAFTGKEEIGAAFTNYLNLFHTVYHINGQQTLTFTGENTVDGISYCQVVLIREEDGKDVMLTQGVRYHDSYEKVGDNWLIAGRKSYFMWSKTDVIDKA